MSPDLLFCGNCSIEFRLSDISMFIEHKKQNCQVQIDLRSASYISGDKWSRDDVKRNSLECVQCFRKFPNAWPFLVHIQVEHQSIFVSHLEQDHGNNLGNDMLSFMLDTPNPNSTPDIESKVNSEVQTDISFFHVRTNDSGDRDAKQTVKNPTNLCIELGMNGSSDCDTDLLENTCNCPCTGVGSVQMRNLNLSGEVSQDFNLPKKRKKAFCCPCPPKVIECTSIEVQTDFDPEFSVPDYEEMFMLLNDDVMRDVGPLGESKSGSVDANNFPTVGEKDPLSSILPEKPVSNVGCQTMKWSHSSAISDGALQSSDNVLTTNAVHDPFEMEPVGGQPVLIADNPATNNLTTAMESSTPTSNCQNYRTSAQAVYVHDYIGNHGMYGQFITDNIPISKHNLDATRARVLICNLCSKVYRQRVHLRKHMMMVHHSREKPYHCSYCAYSTVEKSHLTVHVRTHTGERPFVCRACTYSSTQNCTLKAHYRRKHASNVISCTKCGSKFYTELELSKHERTCSI